MENMETKEKTPLIMSYVESIHDVKKGYVYLSVAEGYFGKFFAIHEVVSIGPKWLNSIYWGHMPSEKEDKHRLRNRTFKHKPERASDFVLCLCKADDLCESDFENGGYCLKLPYVDMTKYSEFLV